LDGTADVTGVRKSYYGNKITVTGKAYDGQTATCMVQVYEGTVEVDGITINSDTVTLTVGQSTNLIATVSPADATNKTVK
jgi:alpha-amylase